MAHIFGDTWVAPKMGCVHCLLAIYTMCVIGTKDCPCASNWFFNQNLWFAFLPRAFMQRNVPGYALTLVFRRKSVDDTRLAPSNSSTKSIAAGDPSILRLFFVHRMHP